MKINKKIYFIIIPIFILFGLNIKNKYDEKNVKIPKVDNIINITLINVVDDKGVEKNTIYKKKDINRFLKLLKNSKRINKESTSSFPNKDKFTVVAFKMLNGGYIKHSIYEENNYIYYEEAFYGIFELNSNNKNSITLLDMFIKNDNKKDISIDIKNIEQNDF
ncbi:MAG: DUF5301 domain-containing protein [Anaerococcus vaginalis]|nr:MULTISPECIES: DUF5301 domain-containing protein [Anaerococcus]MDU0945337.1 DUF5301 domain-containing protein [Anaerococcus vaginalis]MDU1029755.1 DUF5301 domain-containing protein [Anaerococcus vaginalis]MDU4446962.1 DUF5301 domain-containing protein [Anaerococcus vaginalis]MDU6181724.1 DUF5301 domain-containing protein [Anaerococcus vaginalis]MDU7433372.1 DUF5301 domain-containing protein [Anaerococcus vaginalis]